MGSLSSQPKVKAPKTQVVYMPASSPSTPAPAAPNPTSAPTPEEAASEQRANNLLLRARGNFGTILTSFRGLLAPAGGAQRKTLLGE